MRAGLDFTCSSSAREVISAVPPRSFNPTAMSWVEGHPVVRFPEQLRLHRALEELGGTDLIAELNDAARLKEQSVPEPILITTNGTILAGFGRWRLTVFEGRHEIHCIEYSLGEEESLQFIISHHQPRRGWNSFIRIRLALKLEPYFQQRALDNMRAGGKYKGLANCRKLNRLMCAKRLPASRGLAPVTSATSERSSRPRTRDS